MRSDKFIHHERICALHAPDNGERGCFDVYEDEGGIYVHEIDGSSERYDTVAEAIDRANQLANAYDEAHPKAYNVACEAVVDFQVMASGPAEAEAMIRARFHKTNSHDELHMLQLPNGGRLLGIKTETYSAETWD